MDKLKELLKNVNGGRVLEVATGVGKFAFRLQENLDGITEIIAVDNIESTIQQAIRTAEHYDIKGIEFRLMDGGNLDFPDFSFDTVCISNSLHHLENLDAVLEEMWRVLKPGGIFIVAEMFRDGQSDQSMIHVNFHDWWGDIDSANGVYHQHTYTQERLLEIVKTLPVKNMRYERQDWEIGDEHQPQLTEQIKKVCADYISRAEKSNNSAELLERGKLLLATLEEKGWGAASQLLIIGEK